MTDTRYEKLREAFGLLTFAPITGMNRMHEANVKRHFLESELKTADDLVQEYGEYVDDQFDSETPYGAETRVSAARQKLIWLLERLQESVL